MIMITYKQVDESCFKAYDEIPMLIHVNSVYAPKAVNGGLGGIVFEEIKVEPYIRDMGLYGSVSDYSKQFDMSNWAVFMAFDGDKAVGGAIAASKTKEIRMLDGRDDLCVLFDLRVDDTCKGMGVGTKLLQMVIEWSRANRLKQVKIESQTNNVPACKFYAKQGAVLRAVNEYAYLDDPYAREYEMQVVWYLDL